MEDIDSDVSKLNGHEFESLVEKLVQKMGFITEERKLAADGGIDILATSYVPMFEGKYVIQCKRWTSPIGEPVLRDLYGVVHSKNANKGILITNSTFTEAAIEFARNKELELIDGDKLQDLLQKHEILISERSLVRLPNQLHYMVNNFVPAVETVRNQVDQIKNGRVYLEKVSLEYEQWIRQVQATDSKIQGYCTFFYNIVTQSLHFHLLEEPPNTRAVESDCEEIMAANRSLVNDYKYFASIIPPPTYAILHQQYLDVFYELFGILFGFADKIEEIKTLPIEQLRNHSIHIDVVEFQKRRADVITSIETRA